MKNNYRITGEYVEIELKNPDRTDLITRISLCDLPKLLGKNNTWRAIKYGNSETYYVIGFDKKVKGKSKKISLHRFILEPDDSKVVDHINGNGLDNTRGNIRITTQKINMRNRNKVNKNNSLDEPNISLVKDVNKYRVSFMDNNRCISFGYYVRLDQAKGARDYIRSLINDDLEIDLFENKTWIRKKLRKWFSLD